MAKYMLLFVGDDEEWRATNSKEEIARTYAQIGKWWGELVDKGVIKGGEELGSPRKATTVKRVNGKIQVTDGPFIESKENVGGFALIEVPDLDGAIAVAKTWPGGDVEVRPVVEH